MLSSVKEENDADCVRDFGRKAWNDVGDHKQ
jgi:hypothetical protein